MKERPILFSGDMVRAILEGRKTQTRRPVKRDLANAFDPPRGPEDVAAGYPWVEDEHGDSHKAVDCCPFGKPGDRLWVREMFWVQNEMCDHEYCPGCDMGSTLSLGKDFCRPDYVATPNCYQPPNCKHSQTVKPYEGLPCPGHWWLSPPENWDGDSHEDHINRGQWEWLPYQYYTKHPSIHMPRWASRITLEIISVRLGRILDISEYDAKAEGAEKCYPTTAVERAGTKTVYIAHEQETYRCGFEMLWKSIYGIEAWTANPWVWVVEFKRI